MDRNPAWGTSAARPRSARQLVVGVFAAMTAALLLVALMLVPAPARAPDAPVVLGTAANYPVLGGRSVINSGPTSVDGNLGVSAGTAITGFPLGTVAGATHVGDAQAAHARADLVTAFDDAAGRTATADVTGDLGGRTLTSGVYRSTSAVALSGAVTLNGRGDPNAVFIFQIESDLTTGSASAVVLVGGASACRIFWQVGGSATLGPMSYFKGTIMAMDSIEVAMGTVVRGRALARDGAVTLDSNTFVKPDCDSAPSSSTITTITVDTRSTRTPVASLLPAGSAGHRPWWSAP